MKFTLFLGTFVVPPVVRGFMILGDDAGQPSASGERGTPVKEQWPWYHSAADIHDKMSSLAGQCQGADLTISQVSEINSANAAGQVVQLDVVRISKAGGNQPKPTAMLVYGEHAREIISPESALHFVQTLCGSGPEASRANRVLDNVSFTIIPNANPISRQQVEDGYYCKRTNEDGVDLNRNFGDEHRVSTAEVPGEETNPGPSGFSEPESRMIKQVLDLDRPEIYVSVHSGAYLLGTPFGYTSDKVPDNEMDMLEVLQPISEKYCNGDCPYGNLARLIAYQNPGCDIDYVAEQVHTPYVFTWEIYVGETFRSRYVEEARMQRQERRGSTGGGLVQLVQKAASKRQRRLRQRQQRRAESPEAGEKVSSCIDQFNPNSEEETQDVLSRWTGAYLELCERVSAKRQQKAQQQQQQQEQPQHPPRSSLSLASSEVEDSLLGSQHGSALDALDALLKEG